MNNTTGCPLLDRIKTEAEQTRFCLNKCPFDECIIKSRDDDLIERNKLPEVKEIYLVCSNCGAAETGTLIDGRLEKMARWSQKGNRIYHLVNCGISK